MKKKRKIELHRAIIELEKPYPKDDLILSYSDFINVRDYLIYYQFNPIVFDNLVKIANEIWNTKKRISRLSLLQKTKQYHSQNSAKKMETKIIEKPEMTVVGISLKTSFKDDRNKTEIPPFFHHVLEEGKLEKVSDRLNTNQLCVFEMKKDNPDFNYTMGVEVSKTENAPNEMTKLKLPASKYVAIKIIKRGPDDVGMAFGYIYKEFIPNSIYIPTGEPAFIYYDDEFFSIFNEKGYAGNPLATVYVPIKPLFIKQALNFLGIKKLSN